jgi:hypothetical protein
MSMIIIMLINIHICVKEKRKNEFESKTWNYLISMIGIKHVVESFTYVFA